MPLVQRSAACWLVAALACAAPARPARAHDLEAELVTSHSSERVSLYGSEWLVSPLLGGGVALSPQWSIELRWGAGYWRLSEPRPRDPAINCAGFACDSPSPIEEFRLGNPYAEVRHTRSEHGLTWSLGAGLALPVATSDSRGVLGAASAARGHWDGWLWPADTISLVAPAELVWQTGMLGLEFQGALQLALGYESFSDLGAQLYLGAGVQLATTAVLAAWPVHPGLRLQAVWNPGDSGTLLVRSGVGGLDRFQAASEAFARVPFEAGHVQLGFLLNLDEPMGFIRDEPPYWGLRLSGTASF